MRSVLIAAVLLSCLRSAAGAGDIELAETVQLPECHAIGWVRTHLVAKEQQGWTEARGAELDVTAISAAAYPSVASLYRIMSCGASMGRRYGPVVLAREPLAFEGLAGRRIAVPRCSGSGVL